MPSPTKPLSYLVPFALWVGATPPLDREQPFLLGDLYLDQMNGKLLTRLSETRFTHRFLRFHKQWSDRFPIRVRSSGIAYMDFGELTSEQVLDLLNPSDFDYYEEELECDPIDQQPNLRT